MPNYVRIWAPIRNLRSGHLQAGESRGFNDRVHGISCRYSDKTCKKINYISTNTYLIILQ